VGDACDLCPDLFNDGGPCPMRDGGLEAGVASRLDATAPPAVDAEARDAAKTPFPRRGPEGGVLTEAGPTGFEADGGPRATGAEPAEPVCNAAADRSATGSLWLCLVAFGLLRRRRAERKTHRLEFHRNRRHTLTDTFWDSDA